MNNQHDSTLPWFSTASNQSNGMASVGLEPVSFTAATALSSSRFKNR
jgi:hypothetical protein